MIVAGVGPFLAWKRGDLVAARARLGIAGMGALVVIVVSAAIAHGSWQDLAAAGGLGLSAWLALSAVSEWVGRAHPFRSGARARIANLPRAAHGMTLAHLGFAVVIAGATASTAWVEEHNQIQTPGQSVTVAGYALRFEGATDVQGPNYTAKEGRFVVLKGEREIAVLKPQRREYLQPRQVGTAPAIHSTARGDVYAVLGDPDGEGFATRLYFQPLIPWIWLGTGLMALGGLCSLSDRRLRVGAPRRTAKLAAQPAPAE